MQSENFTFASSAPASLAGLATGTVAEGARAVAGWPESSRQGATVGLKPASVTEGRLITGAPPASGPPGTRVSRVAVDTAAGTLMAMALSTSDHHGMDRGRMMARISAKLSTACCWYRKSMAGFETSLRGAGAAGLLRLVT